MRAAWFGAVDSTACAEGEGTVEDGGHGGESESDRAGGKGEAEAGGCGETVKDCEEREKGGGGCGDEDGFLAEVRRRTGDVEEEGEGVTAG